MISVPVDAGTPQWNGMSGRKLAAACQGEPIKQGPIISGRFWVEDKTIDDAYAV